MSNSARSVFSGLGLFDAEKFISEVKAREAIWNSKSPLYTSRDRKWASWVAIFKATDEHNIPFEKLSMFKKREKIDDLQKKWRNIRDAYRKSIQFPASASNKNKPYVYADKLAFLQPVLKNIREEEGKEEEDDDEEVQIPDSVVKPSSSLTSTKRKKCSSSSPTKRKRIKTTAELLEQKMLERLSQTPVEDPDKMFLMSLLPQIRELDQVQKNFLYIEYLQILQKAKSNERNYPHVEHNTLHTEFHVPFKTETSSEPTSSPESFNFLSPTGSQSSE